VLLELLADVEQLLVGLGQDLAQLFDLLRRADAGDDVLALRVNQKFAVEDLLAGGWVAREADTRAELSPMLPNTMACTLAAVPISSGIFSICR
jgi:hypothetical protein